MRTKTELILGRSDLIYLAKEAQFEKIEYHMFKVSVKLMIDTDKVIFKDDDGRTKIIKNRYDE